MQVRQQCVGDCEQLTDSGGETWKTISPCVIGGTCDACLLRTIWCELVIDKLGAHSPVLIGHSLTEREQKQKAKAKKISPQLSMLAKYWASTVVCLCRPNCDLKLQAHFGVSCPYRSLDSRGGDDDNGGVDNLLLMRSCKRKF